MENANFIGWFLVDCVKVLVFSLVFVIREVIKVFSKVPDEDLKDKTILITGAGGGLGRELSIQLTQLGAKVVCVDIDDKSNQETFRLCRQYNQNTPRHFQCDVTKSEDVRRLAEDLKNSGGVDVVISNAGIVISHSLLTADERVIQKTLDVNLLSNFWIVRSFLPQMKEKKSGHIVFMNSVSALHGVAYMTTYSSSKAGLKGLTDSLRQELRKEKLNCIKVTSVHPYYIITQECFRKLWSLRIPPLECAAAAQQIIDGIRKKKVEFVVPDFPGSMFFCSLLRLIPSEVYDYMRELFYTDMILPLDDQNKNGLLKTN